MATASFFYTILVRVSIIGVVLFFICGFGWWWLERRKTRELDAIPPGERQGVAEDE